MVRIAPSILAADFARLGEQVQQVQLAGADWLHVDVMDGHFVPNISIGVPVVRCLRAASRIPLDVHLMIQEPHRYLEAFAEAGADWITVHVEVDPHLHRTLSRIRQLGCRAGVSLNPGTPLSALDAVLDEADLILLMSVNPGFGGQEFLESSLPRLRRLRDRIQKSSREVLLEVDGGIGPANAAILAESGADILVAGSSIFGAPDPGAALQAIRQVIPG